MLPKRDPPQNRRPTNTESEALEKNINKDIAAFNHALVSMDLTDIYIELTCQVAKYTFF